MTKQKKSPEISIIVPVYQVEKYLNECIDSILAQTFTDFELILVDDGSPDNCPALCDAAAKRDSRVRVIHKQNGGVSTARNAGLDAAQGNLNSADSQAGGTRVTTPRPGIIQKRYYQEGYYAKVGTALFQIADISTLLAKIDVPEGYVQSIAVGNPVEIHIPSMSGDNKTVQGIITRVSPVATLPARTFEAEVSVDNSDGRLCGGVYADTTLTANPKDNALTIPMSAIVMRDDQRTVYVIEDGHAVRKVITTGYIGENLVEVLSGLSEKDQVITGGQNKFKEGGQVKVSGEG